MPAFIPNEGDAPLDGEQSELDSVDVTILLDGFRLRGVKSGCAVTPSVPAALTAEVAAGVISFNDGVSIPVAGGTVACVAAPASGSRFDLVVVDSAGTLSVLDGAASYSAAYGPAFPTYTDKVVLAAVEVQTTTTSIVAANIIDKRVMLNFPSSTLFDHGALAGLGDDDHPQYTTAAEADAIAVIEVGIHVAAGDPHTQYLLAAGTRSLTGNWVQSGAFAIYHAGAMRVGSSTAPLNTTAGDLTATRLTIGTDSARGALSGYLFNVSGTLTDTTSGAKIFGTFGITINPAGASSSEFRSFVNQITVPAGNAQNFSGPFEALRGENHLNGSGNSTATAFGGLIGVQGFGFIVDSGADNGGTISAATGVVGIGVNSGTAATGKTVVVARGLMAPNPSAIGALTITTYVGLEIEALTRGATNFGIRNASNMVQTGYARFGAVAAPSNTTAGDVTAVRAFMPTVIGSPTNAASDSLTLQSTTHATRGSIKAVDVLNVGNAFLTTQDTFLLTSTDVTTPSIQFDTNDFIQYDRVNNKLRLYIGGKISFESCEIVATRNRFSLGNAGGMAAQFLISANATYQASLEMDAITGSGDTDWTIDTYGNAIRFMSVAGTEYFHHHPAGFEAVGYGCFGKLTAPSNTTAGDLYATRAVFGTDAAMPASTSIYLNAATKVNGNIGFFNTAPTTQKTSGADLTNNVTAGGADNTVADYAIVDYATDAASIRNDLYQLARKLKQVNDALRAYGLLT